MFQIEYLTLWEMKSRMGVYLIDREHKREENPFAMIAGIHLDF
jgi:hypothetical protein